MDFSLPALRTPADVLSVVPYLLGFAPADSIVVMGLRAKRVVFQVRADLPEPGESGAVAEHLGGVVARQRVTAALIVGYGPATSVTPAVESMRRDLRQRGIDVLEALRATDGRYWSYLCTRPACCSPAGTPYDVSTSVVAASATVAGLSPAASREELVGRLAAPRGLARLAIREAARRADARLCDLLDSTAPATQPEEPTRAAEVLLGAGRQAVDSVAVRFGYGAPVDDDDVAWLALLLVNRQVRDYAWERVDRDIQLNVDMWTEIVRRVDQDLAAAPATLLAFAAWRLGEGAIATIALARAEDADPTYPLARLLGDAIHQGIPPSEWEALVATW